MRSLFHLEFLLQIGTMIMMLLTQAFFRNEYSTVPKKACRCSPSETKMWNSHIFIGNALNDTYFFPQCCYGECIAILIALFTHTAWYLENLCKDLHFYPPSLPFLGC